jgi:inner membrane protein
VGVGAVGDDEELVPLPHAVSQRQVRSADARHIFIVQVYGRTAPYDLTMDNLCHTLVGAVCGEAGLKRRTRFGNATLMIAANLPDLDVAVFLTGSPSVAFRRGITHGVAAQLILPPVLALIIWRIARGRSADSTNTAHLGWLIALSYVGVLSHVGLDFLNSYGIRLLMPFSGRWFYGDTLFIIDPWMWMVMGAGVWLARKWHSARPARLAIALAVLYVGVMFVSARAARQIVIDAWTGGNGAPPLALMVGPRPLTPLSRDVIVDAGDRYVTGTFSWLPASVTFGETVPKNHQHHEVSLAQPEPDIQAFLVWSRFPVWALAREPDGTHVTVGDMRFGGVRRLFGGAGFQESTVVH